MTFSPSHCSAFLEHGLDPLLASGKAAKLAGELLQALARHKSEQFVRDQLAARKLDFSSFLKPDQRSADGLKAYLADKDQLRALLGK